MWCAEQMAGKRAGVHAALRDPTHSHKAEDGAVTQSPLQDGLARMKVPARRIALFINSACNFVTA